MTDTAESLLTTAAAPPPRIDVIIRTLAEARRADSLRRAIRSIRNQQGVTARPIVVVNGDRFDPVLVTELRAMPEIRLVRIPGGLRDSMLEGRRLVDAPFFAFLDDDDVLLPGGLAARLAPLLADPTVDLSVGNGWEVGHGRRVMAIPDMPAVRSDPLNALLSANWLHNCAGTFRAAAFPLSWLDDLIDEYEWTWIAFKSAGEGRRIAFVDAMTFLYTADSPGSASKQERWMRWEDRLYGHLRDLPLPAPVHAALRRRHGAALHALSDLFRRRGALGLAWRYHLCSLLKPGGVRYLAYSRRLLLPTAG